MAYFYQHIKGLTSNETKWWIDCEKFDASSGMVTPEIKYLKTTDSTATSLGNIITSNMSNGIINNDFTFNKKVLNTKQVVFSNNSTSVFNNTENTTDNSGYYIRFDSTNNYLMMYAYNELRLKGYASGLTINSSQLKFEGSNVAIRFWTNKTTHSSNIYDCPISFVIGNNYDKGFAITTKTATSSTAEQVAWFNVPILCDSLVQALYFNVTSDIRAKKNIHQSTFSALDVVKQLPIYNFNYNIDDSASIGIIAQEAENINLDGFDIVNNKEASGENGNYMTVKESKLVYIAWKAIQEQQEIIDKQSKEIEELKQLVKTLIET